MGEGFRGQCAAPAAAPMARKAAPASPVRGALRASLRPHCALLRQAGASGAFIEPTRRCHAAVIFGLQHAATMDPTRRAALADRHPHAPPPRRRLQIAVVTETYPPEVNGVASTLACTVEGLRARGHRVQLVRPRQGAADTPRSDDHLQEALMRGMSIPRYPFARMGVPSRPALRRLWQLQRPDVVHIATEGPLGWSALQVADELGLPTSSDFRTNFHSYSAHYGLALLRRPIESYLRRFHNRTRRTMVPTDALRRELDAAGYRNLVTVARGVDTALFDPARSCASLREQWGVAPDQLVVVCVGRLAAEKNLDLLLRCFAAIESRHAGARLLLVGDGPLRGALQAQHPQVLFAGQQRGEALARHYASADLFLFPSLTETFGNVTVEAMASGLPVLAFDCAGAAQLIRSGDNGELAPPADAARFAAAALRLAGDAAARRALGLRARESALAQGWSAVVERFEAVLFDALHERHAATPDTADEPVIDAEAIAAAPRRAA